MRTLHRLAIATALATPLLAFATVARAQVGVGVRGGVLLANQSFRGGGVSTDTKNITGLTFGVPLEVALPGPIGFQAELNYQRRGVEVTASEGGVTVRQENTLNYVELPLMVKLGWVGDQFEASAVGGVSFSYAVGGQQTIRATATQVASETRDYNFDNFKRGDMSGIVGVQGGLPLGGLKLIADLRYQFGLNDLSDGDTFGFGGTSVPEVEIRSRGFSATAGILFTLGNY